MEIMQTKLQEEVEKLQSVQKQVWDALIGLVAKYTAFMTFWPFSLNGVRVCQIFRTVVTFTMIPM